MNEKTALVTGASSGIGLAVALSLSDSGYRVFAGARSDDDLRSLADRGLEPIRLDVTEEVEAAEAVIRAETATGVIDVLVNNAGFGQMGAIEETSIDQWRRQFETNVFGLVRLTQLVLPGMRRRGAGTIVNVGSMGGEFTTPLGGAYHATKYAVESISDALRFEVAQFGVRVVLIQPGVVDTSLARSTLDSLVAAKDSPYAGIISAVRASAAGQLGPGSGVSRPETVAQAILTALDDDPAPTRVKVGAIAKQMVGARRSMSDREWDAMLSSQFGLVGP